MSTSYHNDVLAWAGEQAELLRSGQFSVLDIEHIAQEIEDVGKSEQRELASRMAILLAHLLKWQYQPEKRSKRWQRTIKEQRNSISIHIEETHTLRSSLRNPAWMKATYSDAVSKALEETGTDNFPEECPWAMEDVLTVAWLPAD